MAKTLKRSVGDTGEEVACQYLVSKGFTIEGRNYLRPWGEIDIIARKGSLLVFVEVKSVTSTAYRPEENMHANKIKRLQRVVQTYLLDKRLGEDQEWRIDLACVYLDFERKKGRVEVLENIY